MAINLAQKYSPIVAERFSIGSVTNVGFNTDYDFEGVNTVNVYSINTVPMTDYTRSGANRYGTPAELEDTKQTMILTQDRAFTFTIDRGNNIDQMNVKGAGIALRRQLDEVTIPELDTYRLAKVCAGAGGTGVVTGAYEGFLAGQEFLGDNKVPTAGRIACVSYAFYSELKKSSAGGGFVQPSDMAQELLTKGVLGMVDGVPIIPVPKSYLPADTAFVLWQPSVAVSPIKLAEFTIHDNPPGIRGNLVEGSVYYDCFVLDAKKNGIYVGTTA